jgi:hypothetical protein
MKLKKIIDTALITIVIAGSAVGFAYVQSNKTTVNASEPAPTASVATIATTTAHPIDNVKPFAGMKYGPGTSLHALENDYLGQIKKMNEEGGWMNEVAIITTLLAMSNQKIKADQIGFSVKMTPEMIDLMIQNIEKAPSIEDRDHYLTIAKKWKVGDFTQVRDDHDYLNKRQGGTDGSLSPGVNSPEEEAAFVKKYYSEKLHSTQPALDTIPRTGGKRIEDQTNEFNSISMSEYDFMNSIYKSVGIRKKLSKERLEAALKEYLATMPEERFTGTPEQFKDFAKKELPEGPQTVAGVLAEIEKSYQGEAPFTAQRFTALNYYLWYESAGAERVKHQFIFPVGPSFLKSTDSESQKQIIKGDYESFHQYIDKAIDPLVKRFEAQKAAQ